MVLELLVLGPLRVIDGGDVTPGGDLQRRLLTALLLDAGEPVSPDRLAEELWGPAQPANTAAALQTQVFRLRKRIPSLVVERTGGGYAVHLDGCRLDAEEFERLVTDGFARRADDPDSAMALVERALDLWRGTPFADLDSDAALIARARLEELRLRAVDERTEILLERGGAATLVAELEAMALAQPTRERTHVQLVRALAASSRQVDAMRAFDRFRRTLGEELGVEPSAEFQALHAELLDGTLGSAPAAASLASPNPTLGSSGVIDASPAPVPAGPARSHVPRYASPIVGREDELAQLRALLATRRLVTVVGTGGVGKTRLVAEAATSVTAADGLDVAWCDLASSSPADVLDSAAAQLGVQVRAGEPTVDRILAGLGRSPLLIVLDNCEHVIDEAALLAQRLVQGTDTIRVVATSRERLAVDGEHLLTLPPLAAGPRPFPGSAAVAGGGAGDEPAVRLFRQRAAAAGGQVGDDPQSRALVIDLCHRLGGLPLAIELAAAQLHTFDLASISAQIAEGIDLLSGRRTSDRHSSLAVAVRWSYDLLDDQERRSLLALAVFRGPFGVETAAAVLDCPAADAAARVRSLVERSLLQRTEDGWLMLEPIRQFADEVQREEWTADELDAVRTRHALVMVRRVEQVAAMTLGPDTATAFAAFDRELPDLRVAHAHLVRRGDVEQLLRLSDATRDLGVGRPRNEVLAWGHAVALLEPDHPRAPDMIALMATAAWATGDRAMVGTHADQALAESVRIRGEGAESTEVAVALGLRALISGHLHEAVALYDRVLAQDDLDGVREANTRVTRVLALAYAGDDRAVESAEALLADFGDGPSELARAWAWYGAGEAYVDRDPALSLTRLQRAVEIASACGAEWAAGVAGASLASLEARHGDADRAMALYRWLLPLWRRGGDSSVVWTALRSVATLLCRVDEPRLAAVVLHAVRSTPAGHELFGADVERMAELERCLLDELGPDGVEAAAREGRGLEVTTLTDLVLRCFEVRAASATSEGP